MSEKHRHHYFRDAGDNRTVVVTTMTPAGQFVAYVLEGSDDAIIAYGFGHSRLAAIADLNDNIALENTE